VGLVTDRANPVQRDGAGVALAGRNILRAHQGTHDLLVPLLADQKQADGQGRRSEDAEGQGAGWSFGAGAYHHARYGSTIRAHGPRGPQMRESSDRNLIQCCGLPASSGFWTQGHTFPVGGDSFLSVCYGVVA
jgi:hypothetical protein